MRSRARSGSRARPGLRREGARPGLLVHTAVALGLAGCLVAPDAAAESLEERLDASLNAPALKGATVAALVVRASDGKVLFAREPGRPMIPASNTKILTALAALETFGPTFQFETGIYADREPDARGAVQTLMIRGSGDPALNSEDWWMMASKLRNQGLRVVEGDLLLDDHAFDGERWNPSWNGVSSRAYHAPVGALSANYGSFAITVTPGAKVGDPVRVALDPPVDYLHLSNKAKTTTALVRQSVVVDRAPGRGFDRVVVSGNVQAGGEAKSYYRSVSDPTLYAGSVLRMQLRAVGIEVKGEVRVGGIPDDAVELHAFDGRPMREIVRLFMKYSNNAVAESLVKSMGRVASSGMGSWETGVPEMRRKLLSLGIRGKDFKLVDGSGLSYENRITPNGLVQALKIARRSFAFGPEFSASLPIAARDGTLEKRADESAGSVRAKTGLLNGVTALSGFADRGRGHRSGGVVVFSVIVNGYQRGDDGAMSALDDFAAELIRAPEEAPAAN